MTLTLYIVRHGERMDQIERSFALTSPTPFDPPLTPKGKRQAERTGSYIYTLQQESVSNDTKSNIEYIITTSPFARTSKTAIGIAEGIYSSDPNSKIKFRIDSSLAEWHTSAYFPQAVPNSIISKRFEEIHEKGNKEDNSGYHFEVDFSYTPVLNELPKYPEGIHEVLKRCQNALAGISSPFIQQIKQDRLSEDTEKLDTDVVLILITHGWCFNVIQEACSKAAGWKEAGFCAVTRAKWIPKEDDDSEGVESGGGIPDITVSNIDGDDEDSEKSEIEKKNEEAINSLNAVNPDGKWIIDIIANTDHIKEIK